MEKLLPLSRSQERWILHLHTKRHRDSERHFFAEGIRTVAELLNSPYNIAYIVCSERILPTHGALVEQALALGIQCYVTNDSVMARLADTRSPQGILAIVHYPKDQKWTAIGNWIALDTINDPGNAGTIVRTARWFGFDGVILSKESVDHYNPKFVRATMGALFHMTVVEENLEVVLSQASATHRIIGTKAHGGTPLSSYSPATEPFVLVIGSEAHGISPTLHSIIQEWLTIDGSRMFDSLNAAIAAGIIMYHLRPRHV